MSKNYRNQPVIPEDNDIAKKFSEALEKNAVMPKRIDESIFDQINSIMGNKSKFRSVEEVVQDMKKRSGYADYINKSSEEEVISKKAQAKPDSLPNVFKSNPDVKSAIDNYIHDSNGNLPIYAIIKKIKDIFGKDVSEQEWEDEKLKYYVAKTNLAEKAKDHNTPLNDLGKITYDDNEDLSNSDAFAGLKPYSE